MDSVSNVSNHHGAQAAQSAQAQQTSSATPTDMSANQAQSLGHSFQNHLNSTEANTSPVSNIDMGLGKLDPETAKKFEEIAKKLPDDGWYNIGDLNGVEAQTSEPFGVESGELKREDMTEDTKKTLDDLASHIDSDGWTNLGTGSGSNGNMATAGTDPVSSGWIDGSDIIGLPSGSEVNEISLGGNVINFPSGLGSGWSSLR